MLETNNIALKEWAVVCQALASGWQQILFRTGGIDEGPNGFQPEHREFWLFPTRFHQAASGIREEFVSAAELNDIAPPNGDEIALRHYCRIEEIVWSNDRTRLARLDPFHILTPETVDTRFTYRQAGLFVLVLQTWSLPEPVIVPHEARYDGCHSWVALSESLPTAALRRIPQPDVKSAVQALLLPDDGPLA